MDNGTSREDLIELLTPKSDRGGRELYIWGTGNTTALYQEGIKRIGLEVKGYIDGDLEMRGKEVFGSACLSPEDIDIKENVLILVSTPQPKLINEIGKRIDEMGIEWCHIDEFILSEHKEEVLESYDLLEDERSKEVYAHIIMCRIKGIYPEDKYVDKETYFGFRDFGEQTPGEVYVDAGAYVGDTLEKYIFSTEGVFKKVIAIEPDSENVKALNVRIERLKKEWNLSNEQIDIIPYGLSDISTVKFVKRYETNNGLGTRIISEKEDMTDEVRVVCLDDIIDEKIGFLKADIESYEYRMLTGARKAILANTPKMAICIYHNSVDLYQLILYVKKIYPEYHFAIRHHGHRISETVLYAYV